MKTRTLSVATIAALLPLTGMLLPTMAQAQDDAARVYVNNSRVEFTNQPPVEQQGRLLVPLRGILEKMGAYVEFNSADQIVTASGNGTRIRLPIGSRQATVNGQSTSLDVPAQIINGSTMVPLRFVAESLGASVDFNSRTNTVAINSDGSTNTSGSSSQPEEDNARSITGTVTAIYPDARPARITVRQMDRNPRTGNRPERTITLQRDATVTWQRPNMSDREISLDRVNVGATVSILVESDGTASAVNVTRQAGGRGSDDTPASETFRGEFSDFIRRDSNIYLAKTSDGRRIEIPKNVPVYYNSQRISLDDLRSGDNLRIAVDPRTHLATRVVVVDR